MIFLPPYHNIRQFKVVLAFKVAIDVGPYSHQHGCILIKIIIFKICFLFGSILHPFLFLFFVASCPFFTNICFIYLLKNFLFAVLAILPEYGCNKTEQIWTCKL